MAAHLLIIDDESDIITVMKKSLEMGGFAVDTESDSIKAFRNFRACVYDLVMLDIIRGRDRAVRQAEGDRP